MIALLALAMAPVDLPAAGWVAFDAPAVAGTRRIGCDADGRVSLADDDIDWNTGDDGEGGPHSQFTVYIEMRAGEPRQLRAYTPDCNVADAKRARQIELGSGKAVGLLSGWLEVSRSREFEAVLIGALAHIDDAAASAALAEIAADVRDEDRSQDALFWLALRRGVQGRNIVIEHTGARWPLPHREQAVMALALSGNPDALAVVRGIARAAEPAPLRAQAVMALGITDAPGALADLHSIFLVDEDRGVRENAIFAMSQLDNPEAARILEDIIRQPRYGELRRAALFWLVQMDSGEAAVDDLMREIL